MLESLKNYELKISFFLFFLLLLPCFVFGADNIRIVSLAPSVTELLYFLKLDNCIVGKTNYCNFPKNMKNIPSIGDLFINFEKILRLKPNIIIDLKGMHDLTDNRFKLLNVAILTLTIKKISDIKKAAFKIAKVLGKQENYYNYFLPYWEKNYKDILKYKKTMRKYKVYFEIDNNPIRTVGKDSFINDMLKMLNFDNIYSNSPISYPIASFEFIIRTNPDIIFLCYPGMSKKEISLRIGWKKINAVNNGKIFLCKPIDIFIRPSPRILEAMKKIIKMVKNAGNN